MVAEGLKSIDPRPGRPFTIIGVVTLVGKPVNGKLRLNVVAGDAKIVFGTLEKLEAEAEETA